MSNNFKLLVTPNNVNNALKLLSIADGLILNLKNFSCRSNYYYNFKEIKSITEARKNNCEIFVNLSNFIFDNQINELENTLIDLDKLNIDGIIFNDYAIAQIHYEQKLKTKLIYNPSTLVTSYGQYDFFKENNIYNLILSNELFAHEVKEIGNKKPNDFSLMVQIHGLSLIMFSRWNLVSNFKKYTNDLDSYESNKIIFIKELNKVYPNIIYENEYGTHMFSGYCLSLIEHLLFLKENNINYGYIDTFLLKNEDSDIEVINIYKDALANFNQVQNYKEQLANISEYELSSGFIGGLNEIKHTFKIK